MSSDNINANRQNIDITITITDNLCPYFDLNETVVHEMFKELKNNEDGGDILQVEHDKDEIDDLNYTKNCSDVSSQNDKKENQLKSSGWIN